jgi:hypothetical protein
MPYSSDPRVDELVQKLLNRVDEPNPYTRRYMTLDDVKAVVERAFGKAAAKSIQVTVH